MALTASSYGLSFYEYKGGKNRMAVSTYYIASGYSTSIGQGDPLNMGTSGYVTAYTAPSTPTSPNVATATTTTIGTAVSFSWISTTGTVMNNQPYFPGGTTTYNGNPIIVTVADLVSNVYKIQASASLGLTSPATAVGKNYSMIISGNYAPSSSTGQSRAALDVSTNLSAPNYWLTLKIVGLAPATTAGSTNSWYDTYPDLLVMINNHTFKPGTNGTN